MGKSVKEGMMPKEIVNSRYAGKSTPDGGPVEESFVKVGWTKELDHVEMTVARPCDELPNTRTIYDVLVDDLAFVDQHRQDSKWTGNSNYADLLNTMIAVHKQGWYVQLDRAGINRLIKVLRQARDEAFGKDE